SRDWSSDVCSSDLPAQPQVTAFFDENTNTFSYVVKDPLSNTCAVVDAVLEFDYASGATSYQGAEAIIAFVRTNQLDVEWLIETHAHADHLSALTACHAGLSIRRAIPRPP